MSNVRDALRNFIGKKLVDVSHNDPEDVAGTGEDGFIVLMFENGSTLTFYNVESEHYKSPGCMSFFDAEGKGDGMFHPHPEQAAARMWAVEMAITEEGEINHLIPCWGKIHSISPYCHCRPVKKIDDGNEHYEHSEVPE